MITYYGGRNLMFTAVVYSGEDEEAQRYKETMGSRVDQLPARDLPES